MLDHHHQALFSTPLHSTSTLIEGEVKKAEKKSMAANESQKKPKGKSGTNNLTLCLDTARKSLKEFRYEDAIKICLEVRLSTHCLNNH
jgi:hypothetical protein